MKLTPFKLLALSLFVCFSSVVPGRAQGGHRQHVGAQREVRAYVKANVQPVLRQQRQKLEPQLAPADRTQLAAYRTQLKTLRDQRQALRKSLAPAPATGARPVLTDAQREQRQQLHSQTKAIMRSVAQMAQKYEAAIQQLANEVAPQKEQWAADLKVITTKNLTPEQQARRAARGGRMGQQEGRHHFLKPTKFLLLDPNAPATAPEGGVGNTSFYPNPAAAASQLEYDVKKAGPVTVDLLDSKGNNLRTVVSESHLEKGRRTEQLDLRDLPAGTYFYKITTKAGSETKRFVKE